MVLEHSQTNKNEKCYFFVESVVFLVLSIDILVESGAMVLVVSVFTVVVVSVVVVEEDPEPQAAKTLTANTVNNFFILKN